MFVLARTITYAALFIGFLLVFLPARVLAWSGVTRPSEVGVAQVAGMVAAGLGSVVALWCVFTMAVVGKGTPAPFDPPRRLVDRGPYGFVRNPMYVGAVVALAGAALFYQSPALAGYAAAFLVASHILVVSYEEPTLRTTFGADYDEYRERVPRWWPRKRRHLVVR